MPRRALIVLALAAGAAVAGPAGADVIRPRVLWWNGLPDPAHPGVNLLEVGVPNCHHSGPMLLEAKTPGGERVVLLLEDGQYRPVFRLSDPVPGGQPGQAFSEFAPPSTDGDSVGLHAGVAGPGPESVAAILLDHAGLLTRAATSDESVPEVSPTATIDYFEAPAHAGPGRIAFGAHLFDPAAPNNRSSAVFAYTHGQRTVIAACGQPAPGTAGTFGPIVNTQSWDAPRYVWGTDDGAIIFRSGVTGGLGNQGGYWTHDEHGLRLSVYFDESPVNVPGATTIPTERAVVRQDRSFLFLGKLYGDAPAVTSRSDTALFLCEYAGAGPRSHTLSVLVREGDPIPNDPYERVLAVNTNFSTSEFQTLQAGDGGHVSFNCRISTLSGAFPGFGIFVHDGTELRTVALSDQVTDRGTIVNPPYPLVRHSAVGPQGQVAFWSNTGVPAQETILVNYDGQLRVVARVGDLLEVAPGVQRTIIGFYSTPWVDFDRHGNFYLLVRLDAWQQAVISIPARACFADLTGSALAAHPAYGSPSGTLDSDDFFYYLQQYSDGNWLVADMTTTANPAQPGFGVPDSVINSDDFFFYLTKYAGGC